MMGESPTRPGIFHDNPDVVVVPEISPFSFTARQLIVPVGGLAITAIARAISISSCSQISARRSRNSGESNAPRLPVDAPFPFHSGLSLPCRPLNELQPFHPTQ